jgi:DNA replication and repair protein RecF
MFLDRISLINFKNYPDASLEFSEGVNAFVGDNGSGKTNLLDSIHYLALCKSYFNPIDVQNIRQGEEFFVLQGIFVINGTEEAISCGLKKGQKKVFKRNQKEYDRLADHIGLIPVVMISPVDSCLITEGSEERRKFLDSIISQLDRNYLEDLIAYMRILSQRNAYLKQAAQNKSLDMDTLLIWDDQLVQYGQRIHKARTEFISELIPVFEKYYSFITEQKESVDLNYESQLNEKDFTEALAMSLDKDRYLQYTSVGIHKDDLTFLINDMPVKRFASQGQQKSFLIALKLAQYDFMRNHKRTKPVLLLDDIFDKLDDHRVARLMELVSNKNFGQIFITDTHPERIRHIFAAIGTGIRTFLVSSGTVVPDTTTVSD